jgi:hypothetical protein
MAGVGSKKYRLKTLLVGQQDVALEHLGAVVFLCVPTSNDLGRIADCTRTGCAIEAKITSLTPGA